MAEEAEQVPVAAEESGQQEEAPAADPPAPTPAAEAPAEPAEPPAERKVKFDSPAMTFDEAQKEIDSIKARAGEAKDSLRSTTASYSTPSSYSSSSSSTNYTDAAEMPKSKNMLSHLTSNSAMLNYKVQTARSLVRKQEDLLRNLARMREAMERSEVEIGKVANYYGGSRIGNVFQRVEARRQARATSLGVADDYDVEERGSIRSSIHDSIRSGGVEVMPVVAVVPIPATASVVDAGNDEEGRDFDREIEEIKNRVANISRRCNDVPVTSGLNYSEDYEPTYPTSNYRDLYSYDDPYEVNQLTSSVYTPRVTSSHAPAAHRNSYYDYVLNSLDDYPISSSYPGTDYMAF